MKKFLDFVAGLIVGLVLLFVIAFFGLIIYRVCSTHPNGVLTVVGSGVLMLAVVWAVDRLGL